ncbi:hypothetical protein ACQKOE_09925 [Novosphingobium sp. NPDC080210]|uniref:hypothetical protein n=1 Tax=Novosphingobium sp. NPDC080210 TaxID=3390596 RepID=UPI003CFFBC02
MTTPNEGVNDTGFSRDEATNAFLNQWADADKPSDSGKGGTPNDIPEDDEEDATDLDLFGDEDSEEDTDESTEADADQSDAEDEDDSSLEATDDHKVSVTVDGETKTVSVKELKRLFGQEAALTRKSQEVAAARKAAEQDGEKFIIASQRLMEKAEARFAPFENIDWLVAQQRLTPDEFAALRREAKDAYDEIQFIRNETESVLSNIQTVKAQERAEAAKESIKVLERDIPGWNRELYNKVCNYAVQSGMEPQIVSTIIEPTAIKLIHKAMRYDELKAKAKQKKTTPQGSPKRVVKSSNQPSGRIGKSNKGSDAIAQLRRSGSRDDAANAFMARWSSDND